MIFENSNLRRRGDPHIALAMTAEVSGVRGMRGVPLDHAIAFDDGVVRDHVDFEERDEDGSPTAFRSCGPAGGGCNVLL